jgi:hypothetical protein
MTEEIPHGQGWADDGPGCPEDDGFLPAPVTGDDVIDAALARLEASSSGSLDEQIAAGEEVHQRLQGRLADLGGG